MMPIPTQSALLLNALVAFLLLYALVADLRNRSIPNKAWKIAATILVPLRLITIIQGQAPAWAVIVWGVTLTAASLMLWVTRQWGGADAKGTILLSWVMPFYWTGTAWLHPLLLAIPISLGAVLIWQEYVKPGAVAFFAFYTPGILVSLSLFWFWYA